jgi:uncharacterized protein (DUF2147 family)
MLDIRQALLNLRFPHVPLRVNSKSSNARLLAATFAAWLMTNSAVLAQPIGASTPGPAGEWLVAKQYARIKIADCDGQLWGVVAWEARPGGVDRKNPDPNLRSRPTLGMPILLGMTPSKKPNQWDGQIYNSEDGHTYSASISLLDQNTLRVQGCFLGFLCGGENWTRVVDPKDALGSASAPMQRAPTKPPNNRKTTGSQPEPSDDFCSRALGSTGLPHERGLK